MSRNQERNSNIVGNYRIEKTIGEGTFGKVKLAVHVPTGEQVAIKILEKSKIHDQEELERVEKEIKYLKMLNHPNIIQIYEIIENSKNFYLVMEYAPGGELFNYIVKNEKISENESSYFFSQIIHGIEEIHKKKICHRDIKPENLLLTSNKIIKIIDFGLSNEYDKYLSTPCGSPCYASPEMIHGVKYNGLSVDLWASGIILFAMICGYLPFDDKNNEKLFQKILQCKVEFPPKEETKISDECKDLILKILTPNPSKRIKLDDIKSHPFMKFGNEKYSNCVREEKFDKEDFIISYMTTKMNFDNKNNNIKTALLTNRHNNITTTFKLLKKKFIEGRFSDDTSVSLTHSKILSFRNNVPKRNPKKNFNITGSVSSNQSMISELNNVIKENKIEQGNIIIINNTNMISQPVKMNAIYEKLINENKGDKRIANQMIRKIDTSVSVDKTKKNFSRNNSKAKKDSVELSKSKSPDLAKNNIESVKRNKIIPLNFLTTKETSTKRATSDPTKHKNSSKTKTNNIRRYNQPMFTQDVIKNKNSHNKDMISSDRLLQGDINYNTNYNANIGKKTHKMNTLTLKVPSQYIRQDLSPHSKYAKNTNAYRPITTYSNVSKRKEQNSTYEPLSTRVKQNSNVSPSSISAIGSARRKSNIVSDSQLGKFIYTKKNRTDHQVLILKKPKSAKHFVFCTSMLPLNDVQSKIKTICRVNNLAYAIEMNNDFVIKSGENKFIIEMKTENKQTTMQFCHLEGNEEITKNYMKMIFINVGFD